METRIAEDEYIAHYLEKIGALFRDQEFDGLAKYLEFHEDDDEFSDFGILTEELFLWLKAGSFNLAEHGILENDIGQHIYMTPCYSVVTAQIQGVPYLGFDRISQEDIKTIHTIRTAREDLSYLIERINSCPDLTELIGQLDSLIHLSWIEKTLERKDAKLIDRV